MEEYSTKTAIELTGIYSSYISGLISEEDLCFEARALLNYTSFCIEQQERVDLGLPPKVVTSELIKTMFDFNDDIDITFYTRDSKYYDMLTMFKEIKKRGYR